MENQGGALDAALFVVCTAHGWLSWLGVLVGALYIVTVSTIAAPVRVLVARRSKWLGALLYCPPCCATWIGLALALCDMWPPFAHTAWAVISGALTATAVGAWCSTWFSTAPELVARKDGDAS